MPIKFNSKLSTAEALNGTEAILKPYNPAYVFEYTFVDQASAKKFQDAKRYGILAAGFTLIIIFITCPGLFTLSAYMAESRKKEIGVRKILGTSVFSVARLLSAELVVLVLIACTIAFPIAYWFTDHFFLQMYTFKTPIGWGIFAMAGTCVMLLALATVSS